MDTPAKGSVTGWIDRIKDGDGGAADPLWQRYFERLVALARKKLGRGRRVADEEDVALSAIHSLCAGAAEGRFHVLSDRASLWRLLVMLTARKAAAQIQHQNRQKRGGGRVRGDSVFDAGAADAIGWEQVAGSTPTPEFLAQMQEEIERRLDQLGDDSLRNVALLTLEGWTNDEMAKKMNRSTRSIERKLTAIRKIWQTDQRGR